MYETVCILMNAFPFKCQYKYTTLLYFYIKSADYAKVGWNLDKILGSFLACKQAN